MLPKISANPNIISYFASRDKCLHCKHKFEQPIVLPVAQPQPDKFQPNVNNMVLFHMSDTHGIPPEVYREWIIGHVYGQELGELGIKSNQPMAIMFKERIK